MNLHALTFSIIMIAVGLWQFRRAGRMARINAEIAASTPDRRQAWDALGYPPTAPRATRIMGALMIAAGLAAALLPMLGEK